MAIGAAVMLVAVSGCQFLGLGATSAQALTASGTIESRSVSISPEIGGRVIELAADEGQQVKTGQELAKLDDAALQATHAQAQASLRAAQANYDLLAAGSTAEQVRQAQAALDGAQANLDGILAGPRPEQVAQAQANLSIAQAKLAALQRGGRPEQVAQAQANLASAQSQLQQVRNGATAQDIELARLGIDQAKSTLWSAQANRDGICGSKLPGNCGGANAQVAVAETGVQQAETRLAQLQAGSTAEVIAQAEDAVRAATAQLELVKQPASAEDLSQAQDAVRLAEAQLALAKQPVTAYDIAAAKAQVAAAQAQLDALKAGTREQQLAAAQAQVAVAQAQVQASEVQLSKIVLSAPTDGVILTRSIEQGEMASPGATLFLIGRLDTLEVTVYLPEEQYALVNLGEKAQVKVDAYPGRDFTGTVTHIADQAEFTPRNVQTVEGRKDTVFAIRLSISNPDLALKPGTPADVTFGVK